MHSQAWVSVRARALANGTHRSFIDSLHSHQALVMRNTVEAPPAWASPWKLAGAVAIRLVAGAAGPVGGDSWRWDIAVGTKAALLLGAAGGTLVLPGPRGEASDSLINVRVATGGTLIWEPGVQIAAAHCRHQGTIRIALEPGARLYLRDDVVLGRHDEAPGNYRQRLRITYAGRPIYDQTLAVGDAAPGWAGAAVMGAHRTLGSLAVIDPDRAVIRRLDACVGEATPHTAIMPLEDLGIVISSVDRTLVELLQKLDRSFSRCREPQRHEAETQAETLAADAVAGPYLVR